MNCKPGDLALLLFDCAGLHQGKVFTVVRASVLPLHWETSPALRDPSGTVCEPHDIDCRPIRDQDGTDETLTWAGKPQEVTA